MWAEDFESSKTETRKKRPDTGLQADFPSGILGSDKDTSFNFVDDALAAARRKH